VKGGWSGFVAGIIAVVLAAVVGGFLAPGRDTPFDQAQATVDLLSFVGDGTPRVAGTAGAGAGRDRLAQAFAGLGLAVERQQARVERRAGGVDLENLVIRIPGQASGAPRLAIVAHSDSAPGAPGASDDGAGVVAALGVARALVAHPPRHDVLVVITDGEERGLLGAQAFMAQHPLAKGLRAAVNMDARGAAGPAFVFETGPETAWLAGILSECMPGLRTNSLMGVVYGAMPNGTDFTVFLKSGMTGFNIAFIGDAGAYHTAQDTVERQDARSRAHMGQTALVLVRALDEHLPADGAVPAGRAVFGDVLGLAIVRWPAEWTAWIVGAAALAIGAAAWRAMRAADGLSPEAGRRSFARDAAAALSGSIAVLVVVALVGWSFGLAARAAGLGIGNAIGRLQAMEGALFMAAALAAVGGGLLLGRRGCGPWALFVGAWTPWVALAAAAAVAEPAASFLLVVPLACAGGAAAIGAAMGSPDPRPVAFAGVVGAAITWMPLDGAFVDALGFQLGWINGLRAGMLGLTLLPLVPLGRPAVRRNF